MSRCGEVSAEEYAAVPIRTGHPQNEVWLIDVPLRPEVLVFEPLWTVIPGNKAILPVLWSLFLHHRYLLDTDFEVNDELAKNRLCGEASFPGAAGTISTRSALRMNFWIRPAASLSIARISTSSCGARRKRTVSTFRCAHLPSAVTTAVLCSRGDSSLVVKKESDIEPLIVLKDKA
ncbi:glutathionylspermidine synthase family protein [Klebsiella pneumoniae]|nr:glutathionylspermidine synthase family protein [Klebsiella pneumoniae]